MLMRTSSEACGDHRTCVTRVTAASIGIELHTRQNGVDRHGQNTVRDNRLVARSTVATATRIVRLATSVRAGAVRLCGFRAFGRLFVARRSFDIAAFREILAIAPVRTAEISADLQGCRRPKLNTTDTERRKACHKSHHEGSASSAGREREKGSRL